MLSPEVFECADKRKINIYSERNVYSERKLQNVQKFIFLRLFKYKNFVIRLLVQFMCNREIISL